MPTIEPYIGKYYSNDYHSQREFLRQTDSEILEIDKQIEQEIKPMELFQIQMLLILLPGEPLPGG